MEINDYTTAGGKNVITEYLDGLPSRDKAEAYRIRIALVEDGKEALKGLNTRQLRGKLWEIKFYGNRIMYILCDKENIYFLHACKKQKNKAEKIDIDKALRRAKEQNLRIE